MKVKNKLIEKEKSEVQIISKIGEENEGEF